METLNINSTNIFSALIGKMKGEQRLEIPNDSFMPLTIEEIGNNIKTPWGEGKLYSLCHYYKPAGESLKDPEMCFVAFDYRDDETGGKFFGITPYTYQQDDMDIKEESIIIRDQEMLGYLVSMNKDHVAYANHWLKNIEEQGFLE